MNLKPNIGKADLHRQICSNLSEVYDRKNADYGDSFSILRKEYPNAILIRLFDKYNRLKTLMSGQTAQVDESIIDTLLDLANYCIMEVIERTQENV